MYVGMYVCMYVCMCMCMCMYVCMYVCRRVSIIVSQLPGYPLGQKRKNKNHRTMQTYPCRFVVSDVVLEVFHLTGSRNIGGNSKSTTPRRTPVYVSMFVEVHPSTRGKGILAIGSCSVLPPSEKMRSGHMQSNNLRCAFFCYIKTNHHCPTGITQVWESHENCRP